MKKRDTGIKDCYGHLIKEQDYILVNLGDSVGKRKFEQKIEWFSEASGTQFMGVVKFFNGCFWVVNPRWSHDGMSVHWDDDNIPFCEFFRNMELLQLGSEIEFVILKGK